MGLPSTKELTVLQPSVELGDPHICDDDRDRGSIMCALYEPLIQHGSGGDYQPCLATHYRTEDDARTWTFKLRTDVTFHNGHVLEAEDVVATLERACDPVLGGKMGTQGVYQSYLEDSAVKAVDSHTVRLVKAWPMSDLLDLLVDIPIVPKRALDDLPDTPVGSGPYCLAEAEDNNLVMKAFRNYWRGEPPVETVYWRAEPDPERRIADLLAHEADIVADVSVQNKRTIEATEHCRVVASQSSLCIIYMCNARNPVSAPTSLCARRLTTPWIRQRSSTL